MGNIFCSQSASITRQIDEYSTDRSKRLEAVRRQLRGAEENADSRAKILDYDLKQLIDVLQSEEISAADALDAYMWKAIEVNEKYNCVCEFLVEAFDEAKRLDEIWHGKPKPPLFGIPFSVKSNFNMKGYACSLGLVKYLFRSADEDCSFVTHLRSLGAVPFVTTNVPQALLSFVCSSVIYGTTKNPFNVERTPGGSSGGETTLCAAGGSIFGTGSDLAGSLRIPATMCGITTLKPTEGRFVVSGAYSGLPGRGRLALSYGYFTKTVTEQKYLLKNTFGCEAYIKKVPKMVPIPFEEERFRNIRKRPLRIGYYASDDFLPPVPACARVVTDTVAKLEKLGHKVIHFQVPNSEKAATLFFKNIMPDQGQLINTLYRNEPLSPYITLFALSLRVPFWIRALVGWMIKSISPQLSTVFLSYVQNLSDLRETQQATDEYREEFTRKWLSLELDALICPAFPVPAVPHKYASKLSFCGFATGLYNMLDFPSGVVPAGFVTEMDDSALDEARWPTGKNPALKDMRRGSENSAGLPLGVQVVTLPFKEEECLAVMEIIEELWSGKKS